MAYLQLKSGINLGITVETMLIYDAQTFIFLSKTAYHLLEQAELFNLLKETLPMLKTCPELLKNPYVVVVNEELLIRLQENMNPSVQIQEQIANFSVQLQIQELQIQQNMNSSVQIQQNMNSSVQIQEQIANFSVQIQELQIQQLQIEKIQLQQMKVQELQLQQFKVQLEKVEVRIVGMEQIQVEQFQTIGAIVAEIQKIQTLVNNLRGRF
jgi:hypothetical protein